MLVAGGGCVCVSGQCHSPVKQVSPWLNLRTVQIYSAHQGQDRVDFLIVILNVLYKGDPEGIVTVTYFQCF